MQASLQRSQKQTPALCTGVVVPFTELRSNFLWEDIQMILPEDNM
jgi:hypothetical protein